MTLKTDLDETIHYLTVMSNEMSYFQPEMRKAIQHALFLLLEFQKRYSK